MPLRNALLPATLAGLVVLCGARHASAADTARNALEALPIERIVLEARTSGRHEFRAWRASTDDARARGLMYVSSLADDEAMIFVYDTPQVVRMWMKNTYVPLDMLFVDDRGCIVSIGAHTTPLSLASIESAAPVVLVVEIKGGIAAAHQATVGDRVRRPDANWPPTATRGC